jgi:hypothetical protein
MKYLFYLLLILTCDSYIIKPKLCINCKYFILNKDNEEYSKCIKFPIIKKNKSYLITGDEKKEVIDYFHCLTVRSFERMCGENGKKYEDL